MSLRKDIDSLNKSGSNKWTAEMDQQLRQTLQHMDSDFLYSPAIQDIYEAARQTISIFTYSLACSIPHHPSVTTDKAKDFFLHEVVEWKRVHENSYFYAFVKPSKSDSQNNRNKFEIFTQTKCDPKVAFEYYFPNRDLTLKIIETTCLLSNKKENTWNLYLPYLLQHLACLRLSPSFTDMYHRSEPTEREKLSLRMNLNFTEAEETELIKHKSQYQIYLYLLFRQYVTVYPSIPHELIGKKNYHDHNYYQSVLVKKNQSALYSIAWRRNRNKLFLDSSESFNGSDSLMVMAAKKEIFELFPYDTK